MPETGSRSRTEAAFDAAQDVVRSSIEAAQRIARESLDAGSDIAKTVQSSLKSALDALTDGDNSDKEGKKAGPTRR
jgi:hypothetical protein